METATLPGVSAYVLRTGDIWCPRRLASLFNGCGSTNDFFARGRLRDALLSSAHDAHLKLRRPERSMFRPTPELVDDERHAFAQAADGYIDLFGGTEVVAVDHGGERGLPSQRNGVIIRGWLDLVVLDTDGAVELRQFELWHRPLCADPMESWENALCRRPPVAVARWPAVAHRARRPERRRHGHLHMGPCRGDSPRRSVRGAGRAVTGAG